VTAVVELRDVVKEYPGTPPVRALDGVSLRVDAHEMVAIVGPSGSGKSTLLNVIGALDRPSSGEVLVAGHGIGSLRDKALSALRGEAIGFVFQQFHLLDHLTVLDNVATGLLYRGLPARQRREAAGRALEAVGLGHRCTHRPNQLSGGEQQRAAIARAVAGAPQLVLADEPTGNLDSISSAAIVRLLADLAGPRTAVVVITHDATVAAALRREVRLRDGVVVRDSGTTT
jgi:putative ABC transport system ATP-binding protein